ncbi:MAG: phosphopantothenoylcysteine decarboxylase [Verrucomicrobiae bacterium]
MPPLACITCGPAYEPIDRVRRITNFSTGEIGTVLAAAFLRAGFDVVCFRGEAAAFPAPSGADVRTFSTNDSLADGLRSLGRPPAIVLHAAALCDFTLEKIEGAEGSGKLASRGGAVLLTLRPAGKILPSLRAWFPDARIIGWKFEVDGSRGQALARAAAQIQTARTDACILNGPAYGPGFGLVAPDNSVRHFPDKTALADHLTNVLPQFSRWTMRKRRD